MTSTKAGSPKRAALPRLPAYGKQFLKDWERHNKAGRSDMARLKTLMMLLIANEGPLPAEWKDHELEGTWNSYRDAHIHGDFLLIYRIEGTHVIFERVGSHSELF